jgi:hypothetical protein
MRKVVVLGGSILLAVAVVGGLEAKARAGSRADPATKINDLSLELVGQVTNTPLGVTPATSTQWGYLSYLRGLQVFKGEAQTETTALFTFYLQATTVRVIADGPLRIITRVGKFTVYRDTSTNGSFAAPDTFRDGTPVLVAGLRQQVVVDTVTNAFTTRNLNTITATSSFPSGKRTFRLGDVGATFATVLTGHQNMPGPPSAFFAGYTTT